MKKTSILVALAVLLIGGFALLAVPQPAYAQTEPPADPTVQAPGPRGPRGGGYLQEYMQAAIAEKLGLTVEELEAKKAEGVTVLQLMQEKNLSVEEFQTLMFEARTQAIDDALAAGAITQEQADWMKTNSPMFNGTGSRGAGPRMGRGRGAGMGTGTCPMQGTGTPMQQGMRMGGRGGWNR